jgi:ATP-dependent DNA helicase DinG
MSVAEILGEGGRIAQKLSNYEARPQQMAMADAVARAFEAEGHLIVEAGTGVGKSFAYLVPAIERVMQRGGRVVVSTHTIALQEQLFHKDVPFLRSVFGEKSFSAVLVKGRSNYLGLRRLMRASQRQELLFASKDELAELHRIEDWAYKTADGSLSDLSPQPDMAVWDKARSDGDDCLGRKCSFFDRCFFQRARRKAEEAQILIVNHALLFSDLALRLQGVSMLPDYDFCVLDEAHTVENVAGDHMGMSVTNTQIRFLLNTLHQERSGKGVLQRGPGQKVVPAVKQAHQTLNRYFGELADWSVERGGWNGRLREPPPVEQRLAADLLGVQEGLRGARGDAQDEDSRSELGGFAERCKALATAVDNWHQQKTPGWVYWIEAGEQRRQRVTLAARPIDVGPQIKAALFDQVKSVVLTSATLETGTPKPFEYIRARLKLEEETKGVALGSPFDYREQLKVYVEADLPDPSTMEFTESACEAIQKYLLQTGGRAFVLFTSYQMLSQFAERLREFLEVHEMPLFVHGSGMPRSQMLEEFRNTPRSVLFGTDTFWMGVDVPGDALSNVIIVKLPFAVPSQPILEARIEHIKAQGGNPFKELQLPEAVLKFKQGVGRLIRSRTDTGIVVILDPRVCTKSYGKQFLKAIPECEVNVVGVKSKRVVDRRG